MQLLYEAKHDIQNYSDRVYQWRCLDNSWYHAKSRPIIVLLHSQKYCNIVKKLKQQAKENYVHLKLPPANHKAFSGDLVAKILLERVLIQTCSAFIIFSDVNAAASSSSNEANELQAILLQFPRAFIQDVNAWGLGTTHLSFTSSSASNIFLDWSSVYNYHQLLDKVEQNIVICRWWEDQLFADINYLRATDKSRYFVRTELNNCFMISLHTFL